MTQFRHVLFFLSAVLCGFVAFIFGWRATSYFSESAAEPYKDSLLLRGYAFEVDITKGRINPLAISAKKTASFWPAEQVIQQRLKGLSRQKYRLKLERKAKTSRQVPREKIFQLLAGLELADSVEQKRELQRQIATLGSSPGESINYGIFLNRLNITENQLGE